MQTCKGCLYFEKKEYFVLNRCVCIAGDAEIQLCIKQQDLTEQRFYCDAYGNGMGYRYVVNQRAQIKIILDQGALLQLVKWSCSRQSGLAIPREDN